MSLQERIDKVLPIIKKRLDNINENIELNKNAIDWEYVGDYWEELKDEEEYIYKTLGGNYE